MSCDDWSVTHWIYFLYGVKSKIHDFFSILGCSPSTVRDLFIKDYECSLSVALYWLYIYTIKDIDAQVSNCSMAVNKRFVILNIRVYKLSHVYYDANVVNRILLS